MINYRMEAKCSKYRLAAASSGRFLSWKAAQYSSRKRHSSFHMALRADAGCPRRPYRSFSSADMEAVVSMVQLCQIKIKHHFLPTNLINQILDNHQIFTHINQSLVLHKYKQ